MRILVQSWNGSIQKFFRSAGISPTHQACVIRADNDDPFKALESALGYLRSIDDSQYPRRQKQQHSMIQMPIHQKAHRLPMLREFFLSARRVQPSMMKMKTKKLMMSQILLQNHHGQKYWLPWKR